jgi:hypothetical protein
LSHHEDCAIDPGAKLDADNGFAQATWEFLFPSAPGDIGSRSASGSSVCQ